MKKLIIPQAIAAFEKGDYVLAIQLYEKAGEILGRKFFEVNIQISRQRLKTKTNAKTLTLNADNQKELQPAFITLTTDVNWHRIPVTPREHISANVIVDIINGGNKSSVALVRFVDSENNLIDQRRVKLPMSTVFGSNFVYLSHSAPHHAELFKIEVPQSASWIEIGFRLFEVTKNLKVKISDLQINKVERLTAKNITPISNRDKLPSEFRVAIIADEFTYNSFKDEFIAVPIEPDNWYQKFVENKPDIFFCESAWSGPDPVKRPWKAKIYSSENFSWENRKELLEIIEFCNKEGIPTIFWNKEDPSHYDDRVNDFVKTATLFDHVFTSAAECVELYKSQYGLKSVHALPFATNPKLFNPIQGVERNKNIVFAGSWYSTHPDRCSVMESMLDNLIDQQFDVEIYDRYYGSEMLERQWPERFRNLVKPNVPHDKISEVYKSSYFGLNLNTVTGSKTMFARRVFELASSNTLVISNYSIGVDELFGKLVIFADKDPNRLKNMSHQEIEEIREDALNLVLKEHTYKRRWEQILQYANIKYLIPNESITVMCLIRSSDDALAAITWFQKNSSIFSNPALLLVIDDSIRDIDAAQIYQQYNKFGISVTSISHAKKYALPGKYMPVETQYFCLIDITKPAPQVEWLTRALQHLQYMFSHLLVESADKSQKYTIGQYENQRFLLGRKESAAEFIANSCKPIEVYFI